VSVQSYLGRDTIFFEYFGVAKWAGFGTLRQRCQKISAGYNISAKAMISGTQYQCEGEYGAANRAKSMPSRKRKTGYAPDTTDVRVPGSPNFESKIDSLLKEGNIVVTAAARSALNSSLELAWLESDMEQEDRRAAPAALFKQLDASVRKTEGLLRRIEKYPRTKSIGCDMCAVGDGAVDVATAREMIFGKALNVKHEIPSKSEIKGGDTVGKKTKPKKIRATQAALDDKFIVMLSRFQILARLRREIARKQPRRKRGNQPERDKSEIVAQAAWFFRRYSTEELTNYFRWTICQILQEFLRDCHALTPWSPRLKKTIRAEIRKPTFS
jgi:hypothetical protein